MTVFLAAACGLVFLETALFFAHLSRLRKLSRSRAPAPAVWPRVSIVMAARDEARDIATAVASRLADDYPDFEIVLVDDRSGDGTGRIAAEAAAGDPRFTVVRIDELPAGWLGKVHAMHAGAQRATGDWLLFSDGDVAVRPGTLRRAMACCIAEELDLLALVPSFGTGNVLLDAIWTIFLRGMVVLVDPRAVLSPSSKVAMGSGAFNLVRRAALDRTPGFEHLRLETGDDVALSSMVKRAGGRVAFMDGSSDVSVPMYRSVGALLRGLEKNGSTLAQMPLPALVGALVLLWGFVCLPVLALVAGPTWLRILGGAAIATYTAGEIAALYSNTRRWLPALLWPLGGLVMSYAVVRSAWLAKRNGGVCWRDTFYSLDELAKGRRV